MAAPAYWLVVPAAGRSERLGGATPKPYLRLGPRTVIEHALAPFLADPRCQGVVIALAKDDRHWPTLTVAKDPRITTVAGGAERRDSVAQALAGVLAQVGAADPWVLVHDAARPCVARAEIDALLAALSRAPDGALLALPLTDTVKRASAEGRVEATLDRERLWRALTPQAFRARALALALAAAPAATDEAGAIEALGGAPLLVSGSPANLKVTLPEDMALAARILGVAAP